MIKETINIKKELQNYIKNIYKLNKILKIRYLKIENKGLKDNLKNKKFK